MEIWIFLSCPAIRWFNVVFVMCFVISLLCINVSLFFYNICLKGVVMTPFSVSFWYIKLNIKFLFFLSSWFFGTRKIHQKKWFPEIYVLPWISLCKLVFLNRYSSCYHMRYERNTCTLLWIMLKHLQWLFFFYFQTKINVQQCQGTHGIDRC